MTRVVLVLDLLGDKRDRATQTSSRAHRLNVPLGTLAPGEVMRAHLAMFITWRDGKIISQRNHDCFEPF